MLTLNPMLKSILIHYEINFHKEKMNVLEVAKTIVGAYFYI